MLCCLGFRERRGRLCIKVCVWGKFFVWVDRCSDGDSGCAWEAIMIYKVCVCVYECVFVHASLRARNLTDTYIKFLQVRNSTKSSYRRVCICKYASYLYKHAFPRPLGQPRPLVSARRPTRHRMHSRNNVSCPSLSN